MPHQVCHTRIAPVLAATLALASGPDVLFVVANSIQRGPVSGLASPVVLHDLEYLAWLNVRRIGIPKPGRAILQLAIGFQARQRIFGNCLKCSSVFSVPRPDQPASLGKAAIRRYPYRPYPHVSSVISTARRSSSAHPTGNRRCGNLCCPKTRQARRSEIWNRLCMHMVNTGTTARSHVAGHRTLTPEK